MCGLVYYKSFTGANVVEDIIWRYKSQRARGTEGFGFYIPGLNELAHSPSEDRILALLKTYQSSEVLYHHRNPTSTQNVENACHPFSTGDFFSKRYVLIHNGMVHNSLLLKAQHERMGIEYGSVQPDKKFNDSEALLWDVALYLEGQQPKLTAEGSMAFIVVEHDASGRARKLHFARNTSPLHLQLDEQRLALASEAKWEKDKTAQEIMPHFLHSFTYSSRNLAIKPLEVPTWSYPKSYSPASTCTSHVSPGAAGAGDSWQKPTYTPPRLPGAVGSGTYPYSNKGTPIEVAKKTILTPELIGSDTSMEEDSIKAVQRFIDQSVDYEEAADKLKTAIARIGRTLRQMESLTTPRAKTIKKYAKMLRYQRVLILAEEHVFDLIMELEEVDNNQALVLAKEKS